jgi:hypothetical protein
MKEAMEAEIQEMIRTLEKANGALARIFNVEEGESEMANQYKCSDCELVYTLSEKRIREESPIQGSFICDLCEEEEGENNE